MFSAVAETQADLRISGTRRVADPTSPLSNNTSKRPNHASMNRIYGPTDHIQDPYLPSLRDANNPFSDRENPSQDEFRFYSRSKAHLADASPRNTLRPTTASFSSIFNSLQRRSKENLQNPIIDIEETIIPSQAQPIRRSKPVQRNTNLTRSLNNNHVVPYKSMGDIQGDTRFSPSSGDTNQVQQRVIGLSSRMKPTGMPKNTPGSTSPKEGSPLTKERVIHGKQFSSDEQSSKSVYVCAISTGSLYQRRPNPTSKPGIKNRVNKYRRRSEESTQALNNIALIESTNTGFHSINPNAASSFQIKDRKGFTGPVRRISSEAEIQARLESLRTSMDPNSADNMYSTKAPPRNRLRSPYIYPKQQNQSRTNTPTPQSSPGTNRRKNRTQRIGSSNSSQHTPTNRRTSQKPKNRDTKESKKLDQNNPGNLYLALIASRQVANIEEGIYEDDVDHQKLLRIFTWLRTVEDNRRYQTDHDKLIIEQNQRMTQADDNLSLYSEIRFAVDELPPNTHGERLETIDFDK